MYFMKQTVLHRILYWLQEKKNSKYILGERRAVGWMEQKGVSNGLRCMKQRCEHVPTSLYCHANISDEKDTFSVSSLAPHISSLFLVARRRHLFSISANYLHPRGLHSKNLTVPPFQLLVRIFNGRGPQQEGKTSDENIRPRREGKTEKTRKN